MQPREIDAAMSTRARLVVRFAIADRVMLDRVFPWLPLNVVVG
jgi:hypothetical protein